MYSFAQRSDTRVLDEPLYGHFLARTGADRPDREATLKAWPTSEESALESMAPGPDELLGDRVLFCKHIVNHSEGLPWSPFAQGRPCVVVPQSCRCDVILQRPHRTSIHARCGL